jgi:hypothetical protein
MEGWMMDDAKESSRNLRMVAAGRKVDGVWKVTTFLRSAAGSGCSTFWEGPEKITPERRRQRSTERRRKSKAAS